MAFFVDMIIKDFVEKCIIIYLLNGKIYTVFEKGKIIER